MFNVHRVVANDAVRGTRRGPVQIEDGGGGGVDREAGGSRGSCGDENIKIFEEN